MVWAARLCIFWMAHINELPLPVYPLLGIFPTRFNGDIGIETPARDTGFA